MSYCKSKWFNIVNNPDEIWEKIFGHDQKLFKTTNTFGFNTKYCLTKMSYTQYDL